MMPILSVLSLTLVLLMGCVRVETLSLRQPSAPPPGPMIDYEPEGEVPSFHRRHARVFEPHWL